MNQLFACAACGEEIEIELELSQGDRQQKLQACEACGQVNLIDANFNYDISEFDLDISIGDAG